MSLKSAVKHTLYGPPGIRPREIKRGLLKGFRFNVDSGVESLRLMGMAEREIEADIRRFTSRAVSALDIGANDGWYTIFFASCPSVQRVYAFEPETDLLQKLQDNFALNDPSLLKKVTCVKKLVGNRSDDRWCTIDEVAPDLQRPVIFKIDVEGGELDVLRGSAKMLAKEGCMLVIETHSMDMEIQCQKFLRDMGYKTQVVPNGWYRMFVPEGRQIEHNRWMTAARD